MLCFSKIVMSLNTLLIFSLVLQAYYVDAVSAVEKDDHLLVLISITSGPFHTDLRQTGRETWLLPCIHSPQCDYHFFIDVADINMNNNLTAEALTYKDMSFRNTCSIMERHPEYVNYGNVADTPDHLDYFWRKMYKVDWKVCFMHWAVSVYSNLPLYHAFVEDDSYACINNLLFQLNAYTRRVNSFSKAELRHQQDQGKYLPFRTGFHLGGGFDDSSTLMSKEIVAAFVKYYYASPSGNSSHMLHCDQIVTAPTESHLDHFGRWLSWGNGWKKNICNWRQQLLDVAQLKVNLPETHCYPVNMEHYGVLYEQLQNATNHSFDVGGVRRLSDSRGAFHSSRREMHRGLGHVPPPSALTVAGRKFISLALSNHPVLAHFHCRQLPMIYHCTDVLLHLRNHRAVSYACGYYIFMDKLKVTKDMQLIYNHTTMTSNTTDGVTSFSSESADALFKDIHQNYSDFSEVFGSDYSEGWVSIIEKIAYEFYNSTVNSISM